MLRHNSPQAWQIRFLGAPRVSRLLYVCGWILATAFSTNTLSQSWLLRVEFGMMIVLSKGNSSAKLNSEQMQND